MLGSLTALVDSLDLKRKLKIGQIFDELLRKNEATRACDSEEGTRELVIQKLMSKVGCEEWNHTTKSNVLTEKIFRILEKYPEMIKTVYFLFCLSNTNDNESLQMEIGGLGHPKYCEYAPEWLKNGRYKGGTDEMKYLTLDRLDRTKSNYNETSFKIFGLRGCKIKKNLNTSENVNSAIIESLFPKGRNYGFLFDSFVSSLPPSPPMSLAMPPPLKRHKYIQLREPDLMEVDMKHQKTNFEPAPLEVQISSKFEPIRAKASRLTDDIPLARGPVRSWEQRRSFDYFDISNIEPIFDLRPNTLSRLSNDPPKSDFFKCLKFSAVGLESSMCPDWENPFASETSTDTKPINKQVIMDGINVRNLREWKETLLNSKLNNPIWYSVGIVANSVLEVLESCALSIEQNTSGLNTDIVSFSSLLGDLSAFFHFNAEILIKNELNQDVNDLIGLQEMSDSTFLCPLFILIQSSTQPLMSSINTWVHEGIWTNVMGLTIQNQSRFARRQNRDFWTETYTKEKNAPPIFVGSVDEILLIGKSLNLLRILRKDHFLFSLSFQGLDIKLRNGAELIRYQDEMAKFHQNVSENQQRYQEAHFESELEKIRRMRDERRRENEAIDAHHKRLNELNHQKIQNSQQQAKWDYEFQIAEREKIKIELENQEKLEDEKRKQYQNQKDKLIHDEKQKMLLEHDSKLKQLFKSQTADLNNPTNEIESMEIEQCEQTECIDEDTSMEVDQPDILNRNRNKIMTHTPLGDSRSFSDSASRNAAHNAENSPNPTYSIPKRKNTMRHMSDSAFVTGSMELKRNVPKMKSRSPSELTDPKISEAEFIQKANQLANDTLQLQANKQKLRLTSNKYIQITDTSDFSYDRLKYESIDPLTFRENIRQSIDLPVALGLKMANRALMFELLEKQHLMTIFDAMAQFMLLVDGVFASSFCDRLFVHIERDYNKLTRSLHSILEESTRSAAEKEAIQHHKNLRLAYNPSQDQTRNPVTRLSEIQMYMDIAWPCNIIIDAEAAKLYGKINKYLITLKYVQWRIDRLWSQRWEIKQEIMVLRSEMGIFLEGLANHAMRYVIVNQRFTLEARIVELNKRSELNLDNLYEIHMRFLNNCRTQLFLGPATALILKIIKRMLNLIVQFCSFFEDFVITKNDEILAKMLAIGLEFKTSIQNVLKMAYNTVDRMENPDQKESIRHLIFSLDFAGYYSP